MVEAAPGSGADSDAKAIGHLALIGVGLIGGSLAAGLRQNKQVARVTAYARRQETLDTAHYLGLIDAGSTDIATAIEGADVIMLAVPMGAYRQVFEALKPIWPEQAIVTDAGSSKGSAIADARAALGRLPENFVPGHPVAGTEKSGPAAAFAELFRHRRVILTPTETSSEAALERVSRMWQAVGAQVQLMSPEHHDEVLALTSHLPHAIAYQLIETLARQNDQREVFRFAAGGLKDLTRIASSNPQMWADIMQANRDAVLAGLDGYLKDLQALRGLIAADDHAALQAHFQRAKDARDGWIHTAEVQ